MTAAVLPAAGVLCGKKQNVAKWLKISAKWLKISAKWCSFGLAGLVKLSCENVFALRKEILFNIRMLIYLKEFLKRFCMLPD
jgi:hypothetical protein